MKRLEDILKGVAFTGELDPKAMVSHVTDDSREVRVNTLFIASKGRTVDGHDFIFDAIINGASCVIYDTDMAISVPENIAMIRVSDAYSVKAEIAKNYYSDPSADVKLVGVTGTNGKTTVTTLLFDLFTAMGYKVGLISTIEYRIGKKVYDSTHTTPDVIKLNALIREMVEKECEYVFMEVSSHAVDQRRIAGLKFDVAGFTNLTHDHISYHGSFKNYLEAKKKFFDQLDKDAIALTNIDDKNGSVMVQNTAANIRRYGLRSMADYKAKLMTNSLQGIELELDKTMVHFQFVGTFNAYNLLLVYGIARELGEEKEELLTVMSGLKPAAGRFETVSFRNNIVGIIDYAHTPDALMNVLETVNKIKKRTAKLITVIGCGGNRDKAKRPKMAKIAQQLSECLIITSDNPRDEDPQTIIEDMKSGLQEGLECQVIDIVDRKKAIELTKMIAQENDVIVIAGKGHEKYQIINGKKLPFDDKEILEKIFS